MLEARSLRAFVVLLAGAAALSLPSFASAALIRLVQLDDDTIEARVVMEESGFVKTVDVGIRIDGGISESVRFSGERQPGKCFHCPDATIQNEGRVVFFGRQSLFPGFGPFMPGDELAIGEFEWIFDPGLTRATFSINPTTLYEINDGAGNPIQTGEPGTVLLVLEEGQSVPEPARLTLLAALLLGCVLHRHQRRAARLSVFAALITLSLAGTSSAAFIKLVQIDNHTVEARIQMEENASVRTVDFGVLVEGGVATSVTQAGTPFDDFMALNTILTQRQVVQFSQGARLSGAGPFEFGDELSLGRFTWELSPGSTAVTFSIDPESFYEIADGDSIRIQTGEPGTLLLVVDAGPMVPEPPKLAFLALVAFALATASAACPADPRRPAAHLRERDRIAEA